MYLITYSFYNDFKHTRKQYNRMLVNIGIRNWMDELIDENNYDYLKIIDVDKVPSSYNYWLKDNDYRTF